MFEFIKSLFRIGRCCGDCKMYDKCWLGVVNELTYENPACSKFTESDENE